MTERNRTSSVLTAAVLFIISVAVSGSAIYTWFPYTVERLRITEHYELWKNEAMIEHPIIVERILYRNGEEIKSETALNIEVVDDLHKAIEGAIAPLSEKEKSEGLETYIPEGVRLIGASEKDGYVFIDLSEEMKEAGEEAYKEITATLSLENSYRKFIFMIEGTQI